MRAKREFDPIGNYPSLMRRSEAHARDLSRSGGRFNDVVANDNRPLIRQVEHRESFPDTPAKWASPEKTYVASYVGQYRRIAVTLPVLKLSA